MDDEAEDELLLDDPVFDEPEDDQEPDDDLVLEIEGEDTAEETPLVKQLRERIRDVSRQADDLRKAQPSPQKIDVGAKPTLESCEYDGDRFETELLAWNDRKHRSEATEREASERVNRQNAEFERLKIKHATRAATLKIAGFETLERSVTDILGPELTGAALVMANDSVKLIAAVGRNPALLDKLAAEPNPLRKLAMLKDWEHKIVTKTKAPPPPEAETIIRGGAPLSVQVDKTLARLEADAAKTGDYSKLVAHKARAKGGK